MTLLHCTKDNVLDTLNDINNENIDLSPLNILETNPEKSVYYKISDSGQVDIKLNFDDGAYRDTPYPITLEILNNVFNNDDIVSDKISTLTWTKCTALDNGTMDTDNNCGGVHGLFTWAEAASLCDNLVYGGYDDWRMPTITELFSLVNFDKIAPAIDEAVFPNTEGSPGNDGKYWASTSFHDTDTALKWHINFNSQDGIDSLMFVNISYSSDKLYLRCVRGGGLK